jgi:hypothetical protein
MTGAPLCLPPTTGPSSVCLTLRAVTLTGAIGLIMVYLFLPKDGGAFNDGSRIYPRMFFW